MTGNLTFGTDGASTPNVEINASDGSAAFAGRIDSSSIIKSTSLSGFEAAATAAGAQFGFRAGYNGDVKASIYTDGTATFASTVTTGALRCFDAAETVRFKSARTSGDIFTLWNGATSVNDGTKVASIQGDGNATFAGQLVAGKVSNDTKYFRWRDSDGVTIYDDDKTGGSELFKIITNDSSTLKTQISFAANGSATFAGAINGNSYYGYYNGNTSNSSSMRLT